MFCIAARVTAQEPWQTQGGTKKEGGTYKSRRMSRPKRPGRRKLAHVLHHGGPHGTRVRAALKNRIHQTTHTPKEPWQTKAGTCSASRHASRPKSPGTLRAALKKRWHMFYITAGVTAKEPWQTKGGACSWRASQPKSPGTV